MSKKNIINIQSDSPQNETNENNYVERIVIITTYNDSEFLSNLKKCFEIVNQQAFNLKSPKEIYTRDLSEDENSWENGSFARYYGIKGIRVVKE